MSFPTEKEIFAELVKRAVTNPESSLFPSLGSFLSSHQYLRLYRLVRSYVPEGARVLDWGVGNGHFSYFLIRSGYRTSGFAFSNDFSVNWFSDFPYSFTQGNIQEPVALPYKDKSFNAVVSVGVLEHVRETGGNELGSLCEIARVLQPGGIFICYHFPNRFSWIDMAARRVPGKHRHDFRFTRSDIVALVAGAGLTLLKSRRYGILPRNFGARLPRTLRTSRSLAWVWDRLDSLLAIPLSFFCQNFYFVARKPIS